jgi:hypothetical protein
METRTASLVALLAVVVSDVSTHRAFAEPAFSKDIAPIIFQNCTSCHRPGEAAPFPLQSYSDVAKRGDLIAEVLSTHQMPPWKAAAGSVAFRYERRLKDNEIRLIIDWVKDGMPEGNPAEMPQLPEFTSGWSLGEPDLIVTMPSSYAVPADGPDIYRNFVIPLGLDGDRWVKAIDFRPSARSVVHHSLFFFESTGLARKLDDEDKQAGFKGGMGAMARLRQGQPPVMTSDGAETKPGTRRGRLGRGNGPLDSENPSASPTFGPLGGWALGAQPHPLPEGLAYRRPAGADLILATHFHPSGKSEEEVSTVGIYFAREPITRRFTAVQLPPAFGAFKHINIPAGQKEYTIEDSFELPIDVEAFGVSAHAHYLGKSMTLTATLPEGETKTLLLIPDWDFAWQEQYRFAEFVPLPKGTRLHSRITYDNSSENSRNPSSPPAAVRFGEESTDEMGSITLMVVAAEESELPQLLNAYRSHFREGLMKAPLLKFVRGWLQSD